MTALTITITRTGLERFTAAQLGSDIDLAVSSIGLTDADFVVAPTLDVLPGEFRRIQSVSGMTDGTNIVHITMRDEVEIGYTARGFGLFLDDGTLFAVYGQPDRLFEKSPLTTFLAAIDIAFPTVNLSSLKFGNTDFLNPPATTVTKGVVELATQAEADAGVDAQRVAPVQAMKSTIGKMIALAITTLSNSVDQRISTLGTAIGKTIDGLAARTIATSGLVTGGGRNDTDRTLTVKAATAAELREGIVATVVATPGRLAEAGFVYLIEQKSDGASRYRRYSDGLIEMSGISPLPASESAFTLNFPWPFAAECEGLFATIINSAQSNDGQSTVQEVGLFADHAALYAQNHKSPTADASGGFRWFARGR